MRTSMTEGCFKCRCLNLKYKGKISNGYKHVYEWECENCFSLNQMAEDNSK